MTRILGKSDYGQRELRFSAHKWAGLTEAERQRVVAHEMGHYVSAHLHGEAEAYRVNRGHDARWEQIMKRAGFSAEHQFYPDWYLRTVDMPRVGPKPTLFGRLKSWLFGG
jgi:predicted SprT family Zn-dependent metalloprotease